MDPGLILTKDDYERPKSLPELEKWWMAKYRLFGLTREGINYAREGKGLSKKFHDEAHPMLAFLRHYYPKDSTTCKLLAGTEPADAQLISASGATVQNFQITTAVDGYTEAMRRRQLTEFGYVDGLAKLDQDGVIPNDSLPQARHVLRAEAINHIGNAVAKKSAKGYDPSFALIVGFDDNVYDADDRPAFTAAFRTIQHSFLSLYVVGIHGHIILP